jgi:hypothetical protein
MRIDHLGSIDVDRRIINKVDFKEIGYESLDWIHLAQHRIQCRAVVNTVTNLRVS